MLISAESPLPKCACSPPSDSLGSVDSLACVSCEGVVEGVLFTDVLSAGVLLFAGVLEGLLLLADVLTEVFEVLLDVLVVLEVLPEALWLAAFSVF
jgi:hypothetical protein